MRPHAVQCKVLLSQFSVCLSVCLSHAWIVTKLNDALWYRTKWQSLCYSDTNSGWLGDAPYRLKFALKVTHPFRNTPTSTDFRWRYNVSTVRDSGKSSIITNRKSTTGFPMSYRVHTLPRKAIFVFLNKSQLQSNKVCYKVSLCKNFQQQSCRTANQLSNNRKI